MTEPKRDKLDDIFDEPIEPIKGIEEPKKEKTVAPEELKPEPSAEVKKEPAQTTFTPKHAPKPVRQATLDQMANEATDDESQADRLVNLVLASEVKLFRDDLNIACISYLERGHRIIRELRAQSIKYWLAGRMWAAEAKAPSSSAITAAIYVLTSVALQSDPIKLWNRVAPDGDDGIWIDMGDDLWRAIHVTKDGWTIDPNPPILFKRFDNTRSLPMPISGGNVWDLMTFCNIRKENDKLLYVVNTIYHLIPGVPFPLQILTGGHGSAKTALMIFQRRLVDPSKPEHLSLPKDERELAQQLYHHYFPMFDNVSYFPRWASDMFCRACTGGGVSKRALYTDDGDVIYDIKRGPVMNSLSRLVLESDALDRAILIECEQISNEERKEEIPFFVEFDRQAPAIFGAILDVLVKALNIYPTVTLKRLARLADFTRWGYAITIALGRDGKDFLTALRTNIEEQRDETIESSEIATTLLRYVKINVAIFDEEKLKVIESLGLQGRKVVLVEHPTQTLTSLNINASNQGVNIRDTAWPKSGSILSRRLGELREELTHKGYEFINKKIEGQRWLVIVEIPKEARSHALDLMEDDEKDAV